MAGYSEVAPESLLCAKQDFFHERGEVTYFYFYISDSGGSIKTVANLSDELPAVLQGIKFLNNSSLVTAILPVYLVISACELSIITEFCLLLLKSKLKKTHFLLYVNKLHQFTLAMLAMLRYQHEFNRSNGCCGQCFGSVCYTLYFLVF